MKLVSYLHAGESKFGQVLDRGIIDLTGKLRPPQNVINQSPPDEHRGNVLTLRAALATFGPTLVDTIAQYTQGRRPDTMLDQVTLQSPIPVPEKIICVGVNYGKRNEEYQDGSAAPSYPSVFPRFPGSFVGHDQALIRPRESEQLDYEGEIAIIIGKAGRRIPEHEAEQHIAGLTCANEGTVRDWIKHGKFNVTQGKNFDASGAIGPWMVTSDEFDGFDNLTVTTRVNGETRQHDNTSNLMFSFRHLIAYLSTWTALQPGDIISTGTPIGAGVRFSPPKFLRPGDCVEVEVGGIGILRNTVQDDQQGVK